jgi:NNP family nitrate/nitrite transporter-like MFS transporter
VAFSTKWFPPEQQGLALGIFGAGNIGQSIAVFFGPRLAHAVSWEAVFWLFGGASLLWALVFWTFARDAAPGRPASIDQIAGILLRRRLSWALAFFYFITFGGFVALGVYLPTLLKSHFGLSLDDAGMRTAGFVVLATLVRPLGGWLSDRIGGARLLAGVFVLIACLALLLISPDIIIFSIGALSIAALLGLGNGAVFKLVPQYFPTEVGVVTGLVGAIGGLGGFFPPIVLGVLKQSTGSYTLGFVLLAMFALAACLLDFLIFVRGVPGGGSP